MSEPLIPGLVERLRWARAILHKTPADVDREAGLGKGYTAALEAGEILDPGVFRLNKIAKYLGVSLDQLVNFK